MQEVAGEKRIRAPSPKPNPKAVSTGSPAAVGEPGRDGRSLVARQPSQAKFLEQATLRKS